MGRAGQTVHFSIRVPTGLFKEIDKEIEEYHEGMTRTDFITDALKFYLKDLEDRRHRKYQYEVVRTIEE